MNGTKLFLATMAISVAAFLAGCVSGSAQALPSISGADTTGVWLYVTDDGSATISGYVEQGIDRRLIEDYVREELGYTDITNTITSN